MSGRTIFRLIFSYGGVFFVVMGKKEETETEVRLNSCWHGLLGWRFDMWKGYWGSTVKGFTGQRSSKVNRQKNINP